MLHIKKWMTFLTFGWEGHYYKHQPRHGQVQGASHAALSSAQWKQAHQHDSVSHQVQGAAPGAVFDYMRDCMPPLNPIIMAEKNGEHGRKTSLTNEIGGQQKLKPTKNIHEK
jgi:hypothetical protein